MSPFPRKILIGLGLAVSFFILVNIGFFWKNLEYTIFGSRNQQPKISQSSSASNVQPDTLWVPSLGIEAPVIYVDQANETAFQKGLKNGVVHYPGTALPGEFGNDYIFGHSSDYIWSDGHYKSVFALLPRISAGALIRISDNQGHLYTYAVVRTAVISPTDVGAISQYDNQKKLLTLQTSYPVGTALKRYIAVAELQEADQ